MARRSAGYNCFGLTDLRDLGNEIDVPRQRMAANLGAVFGCAFNVDLAILKIGTEVVIFKLCCMMSKSAAFSCKAVTNQTHTIGGNTGTDREIGIESTQEKLSVWCANPVYHEFQRYEQRGQCQ